MDDKTDNLPATVDSPSLTASASLSSAPLLPASIERVLRRDDGPMRPVATKAEIDEMAVLIAEHERALAPCPGYEINRMLGKLSVMLPTRGLSATEAEGLLEQMEKSLGDIPRDILSDALAHLVCSQKWFPTIAAIREACHPALAKRKYHLSRMRMVSKFGAISEPVDVVTPEQAAEIMREFGLKSSPIPLSDAA